ncbi:MAG TPA: TlpA disulfide reductase family protein [Candidatus Limnocylindrales bacterium]|nr:TlpA disulfide reductase family protein [Candidatus Limnocylindrales bacterium]
MTSKSRSSRREAARARERSGSGRRWLLPAVGAAVVVVAAVLAVVLSGGLGSTGGSSALPSSRPSTSVVPGEPVPVISGAALPKFSNPTGDPAVGLAAPTVSGSAFDGSSVKIDADGRPKVVIFLAHWCPHCQAEVPVVQAWINAKGMPEGVDLVTVATGIDPKAPNYPPDAWLAREGWTVPVIVDSTNSVGQAYGLSAYPFWTFIGSDGTVRARATGEMSIADLEAKIAGLRGG